MAWQPVSASVTPWGFSLPTWKVDAGLPGDAREGGRGTALCATGPGLHPAGLQFAGAGDSAQGSAQTLKEGKGARLPHAAPAPAPTPQQGQGRGGRPGPATRALANDGAEDGGAHRAAHACGPSAPSGCLVAVAPGACSSPCADRGETGLGTAALRLRTRALAG